MAAPTSQRDAEPIRSMDDLLEPFYSACKPASEHRIGAEAEKIGFVRGSLRTVAYDGPASVVAVMRELVKSHGWAFGDSHGGPLLALEKNGASVTLEPGAQLELSGAPLGDIHAVNQELVEHLAELRAVSDTIEAETGERLEWLGVGFHPLAKQADLPWVPKPRYGIMRRYLPACGAYGLDMMRRTATVQANFDYSSEEHAMRCLRFSLRFAPFYSALFANSPFYEGAPFGGVSYRAQVWLDVEPARQGLVPPVLHEKSRFADYVEWALDAPMFLLLRDDTVIENTGQSFRSLMKHGFTDPSTGKKHVATHGDWVTHLNTLFPEVRLKRTLEVRGGDSLPSDLVVGPSALFAGIFYDDRALAAAEEIVAGFSFEELSALRPQISKLGPRAKFRGKPCGEVAARVVEAAREGLVRRGRRNADGQDESALFEPVMKLAYSCRCPADALLERLETRTKERSEGAENPSSRTITPHDIAEVSLEICRL